MIDYKKIIKLLKKKNLTENDVIDFSITNNYNIEDVHNEIYKYLQEFTMGGRYNKERPQITEQIKQQVKKGIEIEYEHVKKNNSKYSKIIAMRISLDHLTEDDKYYDYLEEMESKFEKKN